MTKESPKPQSTTAGDQAAAPRSTRPELKLVKDEPTAAPEREPASRLVAQFRAMADALDLEIEAIMNL